MSGCPICFHHLLSQSWYHYQHEGLTKPKCQSCGRELCFDENEIVRELIEYRDKLISPGKIQKCCHLLQKIYRKEYQTISQVMYDAMKYDLFVST
jgi:hypothetical protein